MRKVNLVRVTCLLAAAGLAVAAGFQPLNIKPGYWETSMTIAGTGRPPLPPELLAKMTAEQKARFEAAMKNSMNQTRSYKNCVTKEQLQKNPFSDPNQKCTWTVLTSTSNGMEAKGTCVLGQPDRPVKTDIAMKVQVLDNEHIKGVGQMTMVGATGAMKTDYSMTSKLISPTCTASQ